MRTFEEVWFTPGNPNSLEAREQAQKGWNDCLGDGLRSKLRGTDWYCRGWNAHIDEKLSIKTQWDFVSYGGLGVSGQYLGKNFSAEGCEVLADISSKFKTSHQEKLLLKYAPELYETLKWAVPLALVAMEDHRLERIKCGITDIKGTYSNGVTVLGISQDEVDQIEYANKLLAVFK